MRAAVAARVIRWLTIRSNKVSGERTTPEQNAEEISLSVPDAISGVLASLNSAQAPFTELKVDAALSVALKDLKELTPAEKKAR
jgi:hypothetical protein